MKITPDTTLDLAAFLEKESDRALKVKIQRILFPLRDLMNEDFPEDLPQIVFEKTMMKARKEYLKSIVTIVEQQAQDEQ